MSMRPLSASVAIAVLLGLAAPGHPQEKAGAAPAEPDAKAEPSGKADAKAAAKSGPGSKADAKAKGKAKTETATFGGGCFWCLEAVFERVPGVKDVVSGYSGGNVPRPSYEMVGSGLTGHAEVVQIVFDPEVVPFDKLLDVFWECHDPTTLNRQGPDFGTQYRSIILYHDEAQREAAQASYKLLTEAGVFRDPIVTELVPFRAFYPAEKYHQDYYRKNRTADYCRMIIAPKLRKMQQHKPK